MGSTLLSENSKNMLWKTIPLIPRYGFPLFSFVAYKIFTIKIENSSRQGFLS